MKPENWQRAGFGVYVHWPFCQAKCPYCDFNSHVSANIDQRRWLAAYLSDLDRHAALVPDRVVSTVFFGGGTPSLMHPDTVAAIIARIRANWRCANDVEITLEANPTSVEASRFQGFRDGGVNRISMGIQALNGPDLRALGRLHTVAEARAAFETARAIFDRVSFDLIYARQNQTPAEWEVELLQALGMAVDHLSLYQLTIEDGTAFGDRFARGKLKGLPTDHHAADMYELTQDITADFGFPSYEVSNHAKPGEASRHNLIYWRGGDYVGVGPGAHGRFDAGGSRHATETFLTPGKWLAEVEAGRSGQSAVSTLTARDQALEYVLMSLRLREGCDLEHLRSLDAGVISYNNISNLVESGHLLAAPDRLRVPQRQQILLNTILAELIA